MRAFLARLRVVDNLVERRLFASFLLRLVVLLHQS
jgi:hypothetical protein